MEKHQLTKKERRELKREEKILRKEKEKRKQTFSKITFWLLGIIIVIGIIIIVLNFNPQTSDDNVPSLSTILSLTDSDWIKGDEESNITLIEYSDFQCPACASYYPIVKQLLQDFGDSMNFAYRHFPLRQIHFNAENASRTAEAAGLQNKFWEMHDLLFENQDQWSNQKNVKKTFIGYAQILNLNIEQFENDLESKEIKEKVDNDYQNGVRLGIRSVPSFFLEGKKLATPRSYEQFKIIIQEAVSNN